MEKGLEVLTDALSLVGEGPLWIKETGELLYVDIRGKRLRRVQFSSGKISDVVLEKLTAFIFEDENGSILCGAVDGIYKVEPDGRMSPINAHTALKGSRYNDGKVGCDGRLYMGTFSRDRSAAFYRMEHDGSIHELFDGVGNSNGIAWDEARKILYYNDTPTRRTDAFDFDPVSGLLSNRRTVIEYPYGLPDGMTIDSEGNLWTALWGGHAVVCVQPQTGRIIRKIEMPVSQPTCCVFAGNDLRELVITSAAVGMSMYDEPLAGALFSINTGAQGLPHHKMKRTMG